MRELPKNNEPSQTTGDSLAPSESLSGDGAEQKGGPEPDEVREEQIVTAARTSSESIREKLKRIRKPRVRIVYEVRFGESGPRRELPFVIGVLADLCGQERPAGSIRDRSFLTIDRDNFDAIMARIEPRVSFTVTNCTEENGAPLQVELVFRSMADFGPENVVRRLVPLASLLDTRERLRDLAVKCEAHAELETTLRSILVDPRLRSDLIEQLDRAELTAGSADHRDAPVADPAGLLDRALEDPRPEAAAKAAADLRTALKELIGGCGEFPLDRDVTSHLQERIAQIDAAVSAPVSEILQHPQFQQLERTWRGLHYLVYNSETSALLKIKVLNVSKRALFEDLAGAVEVDSSLLFAKVAAHEIAVPEGEPFAALIGDYAFTSAPEDIDLLSRMSRVAAAGFCPFISAASPGFFGFADWQELARPMELDKRFVLPEFNPWRELRDSEDSRFVCLTMPRVMARLPYGQMTNPVAAFAYEEVDASRPVPHDQFCWMNAAYVLGARMTAAFAETGSGTRIRGIEGGGKVDGLPVFVFRDEDGDSNLKSPTEVDIAARREYELGAFGFLPICHQKNTDYAVFFSSQTAHKPRKYDRPEATALAAVRARLPYIMATARFAHYLKAVVRDWAGGFKESSDLEDALNRWIKQYVHDSSEVDTRSHVRYPLREARVVFEEIPGQPGSGVAKCYLRPWLDSEELTAALCMPVPIDWRTSN
jgi:type VI secretion system protein ImpC